MGRTRSCRSLSNCGVLLELRLPMRRLRLSGDNPDLNCTPKVRQKTFGVQFVYEKDILREAQHSKPSTLWGTPETIVRTVSSWAALLRKYDKPIATAKISNPSINIRHKILIICNLEKIKLHFKIKIHKRRK